MSNLEWLVVIWLTAMGACIGSFLNVVVYRLPAGKSLLRPGSCCPACGKPIRAYHNIPVLGWLLLRGRCYDCNATISPRYPLVELATGAFFLGVTFLVFYRGELTGVAAMRDGPRWGLLVGLDVFGGCLISIALILVDKAPVPRVLIILAMASAAVAAVITLV